MTVQNQSPLVAVVAGAGQVIFAFGFRCDSPTWIQVLVNTVLQPGAAYAVALNADQINNPGGVVTFGVAPGTGAVVAVQRVSPAQQTAAFTAYGAFPAAVMEAALDRIVMLEQELGVTRQSITPIVLTVPTPFTILGEALADSGDHTNFTFAFPPIGPPAVYRNGQRIYSPGDFTWVGATLTVVVPLVVNEVLNADYNHA